MNARQRSLSGLLLAIILIPFLAGLLACFDVMPVPLGDPENSRVDRELDGMWLGDDGVWLLEPYDKRTWLITIYTIDEEDCEATGEGAGEAADSADQPAPGGAGPAAESPDQPAAEPPAEEEIIEIVEIEPIEDEYAFAVERLRAAGPHCITGEIDAFFKAWLTDIGSGEFLTLEEKGAFDKQVGFVREGWYAFRLARAGGDELRLRWLDSEFEGFEEPKVEEKLRNLMDKGPGDARALKSARREVERMIRRNLDNDELYLGQNELGLYRIQPGDYDVFVGPVVPRPD